MRTALVHEWIASYAGSEKVVEAIGTLYPEAPLYLLLYNPKVVSQSPLANRLIRTSFLQKLPFAKTHHALYLPLMPLAVEQHDLGDSELVISSSHAVSKSVLTHADQLHICYMHTPMRYIHDLYHVYMKQAGIGSGPWGLLKRALLHRVRQFDLATAHRPDVLIANSQYVARRIYKIYRRSCEVIYPPVDVMRFSPNEVREHFYLTVSRLVSYKRVDLIVQAFAKHPDKRCYVIGDGPDREKLERMSSRNVIFLGEKPDEVVSDYMQRCRGFVYAADEDFGIAPVEAQAAGAPVIAFGKGGTKETVLHGTTGLHFKQQTAEDISESIHQFDACRTQFSSAQIAEHAQQFSSDRFLSEMNELIQYYWQMFTSKGMICQTPSKLLRPNIMQPQTN
ncbi:glycosyltransferase [Poriferisphaera sp. WC338]|uniref:glycosyltransferase n=1 Tax=Poriferisphaera sp. WC338 TaxID=3425129 RepID=UPI003D814B35